LRLRWAAASRFDVALVFAGLIVVAIMAVAAYGICGFFESRVAHWAFRSRAGG